MSTGKKNLKEPDYWQPVIIYNKPIKVHFHTENIPYPFTASNIFLSEKDASNFLPTLVKDLLGSGSLPPDAVDSNGQLVEKVARATIFPVYITEMELNAD